MSFGGGFSGGGAPPVADTTLKSLSLTPDALTGSAATSALSITQTWNTSGTPTALMLNVTDTASNAASLLMDLQVGGTSKFKVDKAGAVSANNNAAAIWKYGPNSGDPYVFSILFNGFALANLNSGGGFQATSFNIAGQTFATGSYGAVVVGADILHLGNLDTQINRHAAASFQFGADHATIATTQTIKAHDVTTGNAANLIAKGGTSGGGGSNGLFGFGTHSAVGAETITGYVTIVDEGGTPRKLAVIS